MKKSRMLKVVSVVLTLCMMLTLMIGCGAKKAADSNAESTVSTEATTSSVAAAETTKADPEVTIRVITRFAGSDPFTPYLKDRIDAFIKLHPNVKIQDDSIAEEAAYMNKLKTDIATGTLPNMFQLYGSAPLAEYAKNGILMEISDVLKDKQWTDGFIDPTFAYYNLETYGVKGIYGIPIWYSPEVMWFNTDLFKKAGIDKKPETMDDLYAAIDKLKAANIIPWCPGAKDTWRAGHILNNLIYRTAGVDKFKTIGARNGKWTDPEVVEAFKIMKDLKAKGAFAKNFEGLTYANEQTGFLSGKYAMMCNGTWELADIMKSDLKDKIDFFVFPYLKDKPQFKGDSVMFTNGFCFSGKVEGYEKDITIEWAKFYTGKESAQLLFDKYNAIPPRKDINTSNASSKQLKDIVASMKDATNPGDDYFSYDTVPTMVDVSRNALIGMLLGGTPEKATAIIQAEIDKNSKK